MSNTKTPLRVAVIGAGAMGRNHARILNRIADAELSAVVDPSPDVRREIAAALDCLTFPTIDKAIAAGLDAAVVAVPTVHHHAAALQLIEAGVHLLVEKPIASTIEAARDMIDRAAAKGLTLAVGHVERFNPAIRALHDSIDGEQIISIGISRVGPFPPRVTDVGIVIDLGVHDIDLIRWIGGAEIVERQALLMRARGGHEDIALLQFRLANGALAQINTNWLTPFKERRISVSTPTRFIVCDMLLRTVNEYSGFTPETQLGQLSHGSFVSRSLSVPFVEPLRAELEAFLDAVRGKTPLLVSGEDGLRCLETALSCLHQDAN